MTSISVAVEGDSDEALARKLLSMFDFTISVVYVQKGKDRLDSKLNAFNHAAEHAPWFILRDLDQDGECAPDLIQLLLPQRASRMCFRVAVHAAESWLLADRKRLSQFIGVPLNKVSVTPDQLENPKQELVNLARKSRKKQIREDMVPTTNSSATVGPAYVSRIIEFVHAHWNPRDGAKTSESLKKCLVALDKLKSVVKAAAS
jgi:hypothetical protein